MNQGEFFRPFFCQAPLLTNVVGPAPAGRGWDQQANNFGGPGMPGQAFAQGNAAAYGRGQPMSPSGNWDQSNNNFNGGYQA